MISKEERSKVRPGDPIWYAPTGRFVYFIRFDTSASGDVVLASRKCGGIGFWVLDIDECYMKVKTEVLS